VCGINASEYPSVIRFDGSYITTGNPDETFARLGSTPNGTLLLESWAQKNGYDVGDPIIIDFYGMGLVSFVVEGLFSVWPGMVIWGDSAQAVVNLGYLQVHNLTEAYFLYQEVLVRMVDHPSIDASELAKQLKDHFADDIWGITTYADTIKGIQEQSSFSGFSLISLTKLFDIEFAFILVIATAGVAIIIYRGASDRRREIATLRARGMEFKELFKLQAGEGVTLVLLGLILGCLGILIAYTINIQIAQAFYSFITIARPFVLPPAMFLQLGLTFGILVAVVLLVNWREVRRTDIPRISDALRIY
jgi:ABC-type antimicrobial peptide transport system permease subunit